MKKQHTQMNNTQREALETQAKSVKCTCIEMLENVPQAMSDQTLILNILASANALISYLENE